MGARALEPPYRLAWRVDTEGPVSGVAVIGDLGIAIGEDAVYAIDLVHGRIAWTVARSGGRPLRPVALRFAGRSLLLFTESASRAATTDSASTPTDVVALDLGDRSERWRVRFEAGVPGAVAVGDGLAYVVDGDGVLSALDLANGDERWSADAAGATDAPPTLVGPVLLVAGRVAGSVGRLAALDAATGAPVWGDAVASEIPAASAIAARAGEAVVVGGDRLVRAVDAVDGAERWRSLVVNLPSPVIAPLVVPGAVYVADYAGGVYRFDPETGDRMWDQQLNRLLVRSSLVAAGDAVVVGTNDGHLVALDAATGHVVADRSTGPGLLGPITVAGDILLVPKSGADPGLLALATDPDGTLLDVASPTVLDVAGSLGRYVVALFAVVVGIVVLPGGLARRFLPGVRGPRRRGGDGGAT